MRFTTVLILIHRNLILKFRELFGFSVRPYKLLLQLTNDCNSKCQSCHIWKINKRNPELKGQELKVEDYERVFSELGEDLHWLSLTGGEVSLFEQFPQLIQAAMKHCPRLRIITFTTNAIENEIIVRYAKLVKNYGLDFFIVISLDGNQELHDELRGVTGSYLLAKACFAKLKAEGINVIYGLTLNQKNAPYLTKSYQSIQHEVKAISLIHSHGIFFKTNEFQNNFLSEALKVVLKNYSIKELSEIMEFWYLKLGYFFLRDDRASNPVPCSVIATSLHIYPNGDVKPCMYMPSLGSVKTESIRHILSSDQTREVRTKVKAGNCPRCWMNCYAPHSIMFHPIKSFLRAIKIRNN